MSEAEVQHAILLKWGSYSRLRLWRTNTGKAKMNGRWVTFNTPGTPDICGILNVCGVGVAIGIEVKSAKGTQTKEQCTFQRVYESLGALYILARSVDDVTAAITGFTARLGDPCLNF